MAWCLTSGAKQLGGGVGRRNEGYSIPSCASSQAWLNHCDLNCKTDRKGSPHTLVCTKNSATYEKKLKKYHQDQEHLASVRTIEAQLAK